MNPLRGISLKIVSVMVFTMMALCIKSTAGQVPPGEAVFVRSFFAIPVIMGWLTWKHELSHGLDTKNPMGHLWRGLIGTTAMGLGFTALGLLPLPEATALGYAAPILTVIFAAMFLGEEVRVFRLTAVAVGMIGVVVVLSPRLTLTTVGDASKLQTIGAMAALLAAVFAALAQVFVRKLVHTEATAAIVFYFSVTAAMLSLSTLPFGWAMPNAVGLVLLI
jgi:drug/metabolite transporter (DMT)-like permease